ncbi:DNA-binding transcriptional regulator, MarR family [Mucilaginibacter gossypiicola]|uniref:DNA-binding transcriptional regulator, MarR family n=1 Tax=Mucilaginibacter gossypiicola TaxID=551995 RepID=A0A1H8D147_9SPHI|nr:MarR family winged helix-turn-helix transcriptional regulator [Mucilaginibacter gossypiicola]SEN00404.1 DNA-binding transcriptional regulator, MarR family [Mucilaginibacter gossypiicola]
MNGQNPGSVSKLLVQICKLRRNKSNTLLATAGLHSGQDILLYHLSVEDGQTVSALVEKICIQHATISTMIDRMEAAALIRKEKDSLDKRVSRIYLMPKGKEALSQVVHIWNELEAVSLKGLTTDQHSLLAELLQLVLKNLS